MVKPTLPIMPSPAITVSDVRAPRQLADSGQLKSWQAGAIMDVVVNRRDGALLMLDTGKGVVGLPVPADAGFKPGTALQLQVLTLTPLQLQLRPAPAPTPTTAGSLTAAAGALVETLAAGAVTTSNATTSTATTVPGTPPNPISPAPMPQLAGDPIANLAAQLKALLQPAASQIDPAKLAPLPQRLTEWLARLPPTMLADDALPTSPLPQSLPVPTSADWPKLASSLLASWPNPQQAGEPESLEHLLRQALFAEPATNRQTNPGSLAGAFAGAGNGTTSANDWLGTVLRLLISLPATSASVSTPPAPASSSSNTATVITATVKTGAETDDSNPLPGVLPPLPDDVIEQLASLLGRSQQHWLSNVQADPRAQPLYGELLLRQGERLDPFELSVREDASQAERDAPARAIHHVVRLRFDLPGLGVCQFLLDLQADDLQLHFYSEQAATVELFNHHLDTLAATLAADAIHLNAVQSHRVEQLPALQLPAAQGFHVRA
ncbi:hypothetical protein HPT27_14435 [Permianibacter sp. IMCC34836]|uniref:flagellar hook-length control protein FliK n=1 Tax=Permianibacter fluminis TaxID=2738515 RepID=UPI0015524C2D|nr:flagellar hook-length control protein FliK [Permianibacter fluminis]NQD38222.1 hypothetical protein [Permianibacter fluminis]